MTEQSDEYAPLLKTARFDIFHQRVVRNPDQGLPRDVYTAWFHCDDVPKPVCVVTIWVENPYIPNYIEWIEVTDDRRREGIATEVLKALRAHLGPLNMAGATDVGDAFVAAKKDVINA